jgi:hypothetical protein
MLKTKAIFKCKETEIEPQDCIINKIIRLSSNDFIRFQRTLCHEHDFIEANNIGGSDEHGNKRCLLVLDQDGNDGILVNTEGHNYARYTAYMPGAKYFVEACQDIQTMKSYCPLEVDDYFGLTQDEFEMRNMSKNKLRETKDQDMNM